MQFYYCSVILVLVKRAQRLLTMFLSMLLLA